MNKEKRLLKMMPWKHELALVMILITGMTLLLHTSFSYIVTTKSILLYSVLTVVSYLDYRFRIIPDWVHLVIIAIGFINIDVVRSFIGLVISPLPFLIMALINKGSIGGGDIKLIGATGFVIGYAKTSIAYMIAMALAILFCNLYYLGKRKVKEQSFPFAPFFQIGCIVVMVTGGL